MKIYEYIVLTQIIRGAIILFFLVIIVLIINYIIKFSKEILKTVIEIMNNYKKMQSIKMDILSYKNNSIEQDNIRFEFQENLQFEFYESIYEGNINKVSYLLYLYSFIDINSRNISGLTSLDIAKQTSNIEMINLLKKNGAKDSYTP